MVTRTKRSTSPLFPTAAAPGTLNATAANTTAASVAEIAQIRSSLGFGNVSGMVERAQNHPTCRTCFARKRKAPGERYGASKSKHAISTALRTKIFPSAMAGWFQVFPLMA